MNISITKELGRFISAKVESGMYQSASEVVREALRLLAEHDALTSKKLENLNHEIQIGLNQLETGESMSDIELMKYIKARRRKHNS
jgi:antitoxin ParD1/3/4